MYCFAVLWIKKKCNSNRCSNCVACIMGFSNIVCFVAYCTFANVEGHPNTYSYSKCAYFALYTYRVLQLVVSKQVSQFHSSVIGHKTETTECSNKRAQTRFLILFNQVYDSFVFLDSHINACIHFTLHW